MAGVRWVASKTATSSNGNAQPPDGDEYSQDSDIADLRASGCPRACARGRGWIERAGKTTFVETFLTIPALRVVNADAIARALSPTPEAVAYEATRLADDVRRDLLSRGVSFCMETVFSDPEGAKVEFLREAQSRGYVVILTFIGLESSDLAVARVIERVHLGGHDVPDAKIGERFPRTLRNLRAALAFVDSAFIFDNSSAEEPYRFVAELKSGRVVRRGKTQPQWWRELRR